VLLVLGHEPGSLAELFTVGRGSFLGELVAIAGGVPMFADHPRSYFLLSLETLLADPPDVALELRPGENLTHDQRAEIRQVWSTLGLDRTRVEVIDFDGILVPGPRVAESARTIQAALFRDLAAEKVRSRL
jgi:ABC-type hemin transport system substrate-binding protein